MRRASFTRLRQSISFQMLAWYLLVNVLLLMVFGGVIIGLSTRILEKEVGNYTRLALGQTTFILDNTLSDLRSRVVWLVSYPSIISCLNRQLPIEEQLTAERTTASLLLDLKPFKSVVEDVLIAGNNGYAYNLAARANLLFDYPYTEQDWYQEAVSTKSNILVKMIGLHPQDFYNPAVAGKSATQHTISLSVAIRDSNQTVMGAVFCNLNLEMLGRQLMNTNFEENGKIALLSPDGVIVAQNDNTCVGTQLDFEASARQTIQEQESGSFQGRIGDSDYLICFSTSETIGWKVVSYIPLNEIRRHSAPLSQTILQALLMCLLVNILTAVLFSHLLDRPVKRLIANISGISGERLRLERGGYRYWELEQIAEKFNELLGRIEALIKQEYQSRLLVNQFQLYALQAQTNPHFLFNILQLLQTEIVYGHMEESNEIVVALSRLLRYTMYNCDEEVSVREELDYLRDYLLLFIRKYDGRLRVEYDVDPAVYNCRMQKLLTQPIAENCIRYAFGDDPRDALIQVRVALEGDTMILSLRDNGGGMTEEELARVRENLIHSKIDDTNIGLRNVHRRIRIVYGEPYGVDVENVQPHGVGVTVRIPRKPGKERLI